MHCEIKRNVTHITHNKILVTLQQSAEANNDMTLCCLCCKSGPISATLYLETIGFVPGEGIPIHVEIENRSGRKISAASVTLLMVNKYVFLTQCLFQESFNTVKCTITNSFAFFSKMRGFCDVTMFFHRILTHCLLTYERLPRDHVLRFSQFGQSTSIDPHQWRFV